jgi:adenosylcobinamide-GDP ribazoletransferase
MKGFLAALQFLTIVPVPARWAADEDSLKRSVPFFAVVGALIGVAAAAFAWAAGLFVPALPASVLTVIFLAAVSGCLHLDGLSDTADGFLGTRDRDRALAIMKDSSAGPMGVVAVVCALLLKVTSLGGIPTETAWRTVFLMPLAGRCALPLMIALLPYVRPGGGLGAVFCKGRPVFSAVLAAVILLVAGWFAAGLTGLCAGVATLVVTLLFAAYCYRKIGGATGDTFGAACEIAEIIPALTMAARG